MSKIGPWTSEIINTCVNEFRKPDNREKIAKNIIDPVASELLTRLRPYFAIHIIVQLLIILVLMYVSKKIAT